MNGYNISIKASVTSKIIRNFAVPIVALVMLVVMLTPAEVWNHPAEDEVYHGFDPNVVYSDEKGYAPYTGAIEITHEFIKLTALPNSQPTVHLITTPLKSFRVAMDVRILETQPSAIPLRIGIWSARTGSGYFLEFGSSSSGNFITTQTIAEGTAAQTLVGGKIIKNETLGNYNLGLLYRLEIVLDKEKDIIKYRISSMDKSPSGSPAVRVVGGPSDPKYGDISSELISVKEGQEYVFGGLCKLVWGHKFGAYKIVVQWLNKDLEHLGFASNWRSVQELNDWTLKEFRATAPKGAAFARVLLGCSDGVQLLFTDVFFIEAGNPNNMLLNGDFRKGTEGWIVANDPFDTPEIIDLHPMSLESSVTSADIPKLLDSLRLSLTISAASKAGIAVVVLENYVLTLPHQRWQVVKVEDYRAKILVTALLVFGGILVIKEVTYWLQEKFRNKAKFNLAEHFPYKIFWLDPLHNKDAMILGLSIVIFFPLNFLLFSLGNLPFDMMCQKIWAYIAVNYGFHELYYLPNTVSLAKVWGGTPYHEAVFPYNFGFSYLFLLMGWIYKLFLNGPGNLDMDTFALEFVIKSFNVLFTIADGLLIYLILKELKAEKKQRILCYFLFLLNPIVWFISSIWGQTYLISVFFMLASIWFAEKQRIQLAWLMLALGALNRPQMLIPLFILGLIYMRKFPIGVNIRSVSWSVIAVFLLLGPFSLTVSPSMPVDILRNQLFIQEAGGNEPALMLVSLDAYNLWPLITYIQGARGLATIYFPSTYPLISNLSYLQMSQILTFSMLAILIGLLMFCRRPNIEPSYYIPLLTLGTMGFLILKTGVTIAHFVIVLPLLILSGKFMGGRTWYPLISIWTITTMVPLFGSLGFSIENVRDLAPALHSTNNIIIHFFMHLHSSDWFIIFGSLVNIVLLAWLTLKTLISLNSSLHPK
ncbi:MAG: hypothetical protein QXU81_09970 [Candidatus Bathyarchaeia archaeon]